MPCYFMPDDMIKSTNNNPWRMAPAAGSLYWVRWSCLFRSAPGLGLVGGRPPSNGDEDSYKIDRPGIFEICCLEES